MNFESLGVTGWARVWLPRLKLLGVHRYSPHAGTDSSTSIKEDRRSPRLNFTGLLRAVRMTSSSLRCGSTTVSGVCQLNVQSYIFFVALLLSTAFLRYACNVTQPLKTTWTKVQTHAPATLNISKDPGSGTLPSDWTVDTRLHRL